MLPGFKVRKMATHRTQPTVSVLEDAEGAMSQGTQATWNLAIVQEARKRILPQSLSKDPRPTKTSLLSCESQFTLLISSTVRQYICVVGSHYIDDHL